MQRYRFTGAPALSCVVLATWLSTLPAFAEERPVTVTANPARVCADPTTPAYLNVDLLIRNRTAQELTVSELRGVVSDRDGAVVERRLLWQQAVSVLGPGASIRAGGESLVFNPLHFSSAQVGRRVRFEVELSGAPGGTITASTEITPVDCAPRFRSRFPIEGRVLVYDGYDALSHHRRTEYGSQDRETLGLTDNFQRFGLDLVVVDAAGRFFSGDGARTDQWLGWGRPVRATAEGRVASVHDGQPDNVRIGTLDRWSGGNTREKPMWSYGNYVLIDHGHNEFSLVAHLKNGSVRVRAGEKVSAGQPIGQIGNSGASGGVHVHFERRTGFGIAGIETLPPYFTGISIAGRPDSAKAPVAINSGDIVLAK